MLTSSGGAVEHDISAIPFLNAIPPQHQTQLQSLFSHKHFSPGDVLFRESEEHDQVYILIDGHVRLEMVVRERGRVPLLTVGRSDFLGWSPLFGGRRMTATAIAIEPTSALSISGEALRLACEANHELGYHVMRQVALALSDRLLATRLQLLDLFCELEPRPARSVDAEC